MVVIAVIAGCGSSAAGPRSPRAAVSAVKATPRLERMLQREILTLRVMQPKGPQRSVLPRVGHAYVIPQAGTTCYVAAAATCSDIPCREFVTAPTVPQAGSTVTAVPVRPIVRACTRAAPKLIPVSVP
jgi:hypothetical protein